MDDHFDTSGVFEINKFDISKLACNLIIAHHRIDKLMDKVMVSRMKTKMCSQAVLSDYEHSVTCSWTVFKTHASLIL